MKYAITDRGLHLPPLSLQPLNNTISYSILMAEYNLIKRASIVPSRKRAIYAMCFQCLGGTRDEMPDPGYQKEIGSCKSVECPLHSFRPYQAQEFVLFEEYIDGNDR